MFDSKGGLKVPEYTADNDLVHPNVAGYKEMDINENLIQRAGY